MRLGKDVLLEIVAIVQDGLINGTDVSQALRDLDLAETADKNLSLSSSYLESRGRSRPVDVLPGGAGDPADSGPGGSDF